MAQISLVGLLFTALLTYAASGCGGSAGGSDPAIQTRDGNSADVSTIDATLPDVTLTDTKSDDSAVLDGSTADASADAQSDAVAVDAQADASVIDVAAIDAQVDAAIDAQVDAGIVFPALGCGGIADGMTCPGGVDPSQRCYAGSCIGTYAASDPFGNDSYPGTRQYPKRSVNGAKANAVLLNFATPVILGCSEDSMGQAGFCEFPEMGLDVPAGLSIDGNYRRTLAGDWIQNQTATTTIAIEQPNGMTVDDPLTTNTTELKNFSVRGNFTANASAATLIIANGAQPLLTNVSIFGGGGNGAVDAIAVSVLGNAGPTFQSCFIQAGYAQMGTGVALFASGSGSGSPNTIRLRGTTANGGNNSEAAVAIEAHEVMLDLENSNAYGPVGPGARISSRALSCEDCISLRVSGGQFYGGMAEQTEGIHITGNTSNVLVEYPFVVGGVAGEGVGNTYRNGISLRQCVGGEVRIQRATIVGLRGNQFFGGGDTTGAQGISVEGCEVVIDRVSVTGADTCSGMSDHVDDAVGINCDAQSNCKIRQSDISGTSSLMPNISCPGGTVFADVTAVGVRLEGAGELSSTESWPNQPQSIRAGFGASLTALEIEHHSAFATPLLVARNTLVGVPITSGNTMQTRGALVRGNIRMENNIITTGGGSMRNEGILLGAAPESAGLILVNNTVHIDGSGTATNLALSITAATTGAPPSGTVLNNVLLTSMGSNSAAVYEDSTVADLLRLNNNSLYSGGSTLYVDEGNTDLSSISAVNALSAAGGGPTASGNITGDPGLSTLETLMGGSFCIDAGAETLGMVMAPTVDYFGQPRTPPIDIGADEL